MLTARRRRASTSGMKVCRPLLLLCLGAVAASGARCVPAVGAAGAAGAALDPPSGAPSSPAPLDLPRRPERSAAPAPLGPLPGRAQPVEEPAGAGLAPFRAALLALQSGRAQDHVRVLHFGDSHVAADLYSHRLRRALQERFGDGGHGWVALGKPWRSYRHGDLRLGETGPWTHDLPRLGRDEPASALVGLGGLRARASEAAASAWVATAQDPGPGDSVARLELHYLRQPRGGTVELRLDGKSLATVPTEAGKDQRGFGFGRQVWDLPLGPHRVELAPQGGREVTILGLVLERDRPGVVWDTLGINGAQASTPLLWEPQLWAEQVAARAPSLVILAYGANEAGARRFRSGRYRETFARLVRRVRQAAPQAGCLVVAPCDRAAEAEDGEWRTLPAILQVVEIQRRVALAQGCAFWNAFAAMGGRGSVDAWARWEPAMAQADRVHLTAPGYRVLADLLLDALLTGVPSPTPAAPPQAP